MVSYVNTQTMSTPTQNINFIYMVQKKSTQATSPIWNHESWIEVKELLGNSLTYTRQDKLHMRKSYQKKYDCWYQH